MQIAGFISNNAAKAVIFGKKESHENPFQKIALEKKCILNNEFEIVPVGDCLYTFPMNGQFGLKIDKEKRDINYGYIYWSGQFETFFSDNSILYVMFTDSDKKWIICQTYFSWYNRIISFELPVDFLKKGKIYKMQLVTHPKRKIENIFLENIDKLKDENFYNLFSVLNDKEQKISLKKMNSHCEPVYFRVSNYKNKLAQLGLQDSFEFKDLTAIKTNMTEPLDDYEIEQIGCSDPKLELKVPGYNFEYLAKKLFSKRIVYYLKVPEIEVVDTNDILKTYISITDNTANNDKIIYADKYLAENYIKTNEEFGEYLDGMTTVNVTQSCKAIKITKMDFKKGKVEIPNGTELSINIQIGEEILKKYSEIQPDIIKRREERADYYYKLHIVESKLKKVQPINNYQFYIDRENKVIESMLWKNFENVSPEKLISNFDLFVTSKFPYRDKIDSEYKVKFIKKEK